MKPIDDIDVLLAKYFAAETTAEEESYIENWRSLSEENEIIFVQSAQLFSMATGASDAMEYDAQQAWNKLKIGKTSRTIPFNYFKRNYLNIAASILLAVGISSAWYKYKYADVATHSYTIRSTDKAINGTLPDGSTFTLNKNSSLTYDTLLYNKKRSVRLQGEGFFTVDHNDHNPFKIETCGLIITDIGTAFNVKTINNVRVLVSVKEGIVELDNASIQPQIIKAGEQAEFFNVNNSITKTDIIDKNYSAYMDKILIFDNAPLSEITNTLAEVYDCTFLISTDNLLRCRFTGTFNNESIDDIMILLAETLKLTQYKNGNRYIIDGQGCN